MWWQLPFLLLTVGWIAHHSVYFGNLPQCKETDELIDFTDQQKLKFSTLNFASSEVLYKLKRHHSIKL